MRERARDKRRIEDIIEYSKNVTRLVENVTFEKFVDNIAIYYGTMKNVEIMGEAAYMLTKEFKALHPETPWDVVQGMRHVLVHDYANVLPKILWNTATNDVPEIRNQAQKYLDETDWEAWEKGGDSFL
ncbi:MAG: DUF86 domain-containing protein [Bacteroidales bacterium]|nr:DUF86 domain-containing protein [Bacteroidales bacterium]